MSEIRYWVLDGKPIKVESVLTDRNKSYIIVRPDLTIEFRGKPSTGWEDIEVLLGRKSALIRKNISYFEQFLPQPPEHKYESGETFYYLGRQYRLKLQKADKTKLRLIGKWFLVEMPDIENKPHIQKLFYGWYRDKAVSKIMERYEYLYQYFYRRLKDKPEIIFRRMKKRWGSCSKTRILFNTELIKTPLICIDYIIVHELCHMIYPKHSKAFYRRISQIIPDWQTRKNRLERSCVS